MKLVALLRGINVGGRNRIAMADLRELVEGLGFGEVRTHLQSGNVVFAAPAGTGAGAGAAPGAGDTADRAADRIEAEIERSLGLAVPVLARTGEDLERIVALHPLADIATNPSRLLVSFLSGRVEPDRLGDLDPGDFAPDAFALGEREIYVWAPNGASETKLTHSFWEKRLGVTATARNWNTVERLLTLASE